MRGPKAGRRLLKMDLTRYPGVDEANWQRWVLYRREIGRDLSRSSAEMMLDWLQKVPAEVQVASVDQSIRNGWTGLWVASEHRARATLNATSTRQRTLEQDLTETDWAYG